MGKILLILQREYLVRVKKKSFIIMTILGPLLIGGLYATVIYLAVSEGGSDKRTIAFIDESGLFNNTFESGRNLTFIPAVASLEQAKKEVLAEDYYALIYIPKIDINSPQGIRMYSKKGISLEVQGTVERALKRAIEDKKLMDAGIDKQILKNIETNVAISTLNLSEDEGEKGSSSGTATAVGFAAAFIIYLSIFIYGVQVMRGVIEEKTNRIVEVIISSIKPFQLMLGKILGIALVGLTQFLIWIIFSLLISTTALSILGTDKLQDERVKAAMQPNMPAGDQVPAMVTNFESAIATINFPLILSCFLFYFLGGYLIYSALFAAIGAAADSETDTQQFMFPITIPLILSFVLAQFVIQNPDGSMAFWLSMIPLTSPIIMMVRIPFGVPPIELVASMVLLLGGFLGITWVAARIYRVGILMYGKKVNYKELAKWVLYKV
ncbi:ABC transporter permease [Rhodocytophaga aerolata]|uniref:ABC transporter permease n=1 Tax=Rhodocytophaga aerolata TaxID=455078 RepID=A0ABT8R9S8_9BACT|nr:ABC transporter permease [Rhodocytophaga aerolata]MDO1448451.1 ABC transporter permease [Rhodocytophaga aerolata]